MISSKIPLFAAFSILGFVFSAAAQMATPTPTPTPAPAAPGVFTCSDPASQISIQTTMQAPSMPNPNAGPGFDMAVRVHGHDAQMLPQPCHVQQGVLRCTAVYNEYRLEIYPQFSMDESQLNQLTVIDWDGDVPSSIQMSMQDKTCRTGGFNP